MVGKYSAADLLAFHFDEADGCDRLTWKNRFADMQRAVNCYSWTEDTLGNSGLDEWLIGKRIRKRKVLYGKIYGDFDVETLCGVSFIYYLNPTPNDRNLEWDMKINLCPTPGDIGNPQP